uniref:Uncharacterized protein n=1 Tax=Candidatus Kentrum sp. TC TaxID=2126339 RepID=A0A450Z5X5_9GAMM|nr:MAG: hypothetical protein BECKTC1821D_GA0114238_10421 [Candidatus Kentron sp. TC]VFK49197.1 MAG: hypothetical protein BECKTC1821E_GA0114239_11622 [Candidatus Kentron sp. TC]
MVESAKREVEDARKEGLEEGRKEGREEGREEERRKHEQERKNFAGSLRNNGVANPVIAASLGISEKELRDLLDGE